MMTINTYEIVPAGPDDPIDYISQICLEDVPWMAGFNAPTLSLSRSRAHEYYETVLKHRGDTDAKRNARLELLEKAREERKIKKAAEVAA